MIQVIIKQSKAKLIQNRHPWIFSGAIHKIPPVEEGSIVRVEIQSGDFVGFAFVNPKSDIVLRMLSYHPEFKAKGFVKNRLLAAAKEKAILVPKKTSNAFRLVNAEADGLPGLIIDIYNDTAVLQISTLGINAHLKEIIETLDKDLKLNQIYEKSTAPSRVKEGLPKQSLCWHKGENPQVSILEHGIQYTVNVVEGQKTGFFLDQREMRFLVQSLANEQSVLNCFAYTGGFSLNASTGGAKKIVSVDSSALACKAIKEHFDLNNLNTTNHEIKCEDVLEFLKNSEELFSLIILDPPPYVKRSKDLSKGARLYSEINKLALKKLAPQGVLFSFSCSPFMPESELQKAIFHAAQESKRHLRIIHKHLYAKDHGVSIFHPEGSYIKGFVLKEGGFDYV